MAEAAETDMLDEAIAWHLRTAAGDDVDWEEFVTWLERDPRHNAAYEAVSDTERAFDAHYRLVGGEGGDEQARRAAREARAVRPRHRGITALAASVALAIAGTWIFMNHAERTREIVTAPGEVRDLALSDGTRIALNGGTRIVLDDRDSRRAELKAGEAQFSVRHDAVHPFTLTLGSQRIVDLGTVFDVYRDDRTTRIEVAQGSIRFEDGETRLRLDAGDTLKSGAEGIVENSKPVAMIASWTRGALVYRDAPLIEVVGDLSRNRGIAIELGSGLSGRTFTGVLQLGGGKDELRERVGRLLGVRVAVTKDGWAITR